MPSGSVNTYEVALVYVLVFVVCIRCEIFCSFFFFRVITVGRKGVLIFSSYDFHVCVAALVQLSVLACVKFLLGGSRLACR